MRIRTIKPEFFADRELAKLQPHDRLLFIGLWLMADRNGVLEDNPELILASLFPYEVKQLDVSPMLHRLSTGKFILRYTAGGRDLLWIRTFKTHQRITGKEAESEGKYPLPTEDVIAGESLGKQQGNTREASGCPGKERKGKERIFPAVAAPVAVAPADVPAPDPTPEPKPTATDPAHAGWISAWCSAFEAKFSVAYAFDGGRDGRAVKKLLKLPDSLEVAKQAWERDGFACKQAVTIHGLSDYWNQIRAELSGKAAQPAWKEKQVLQLAIRRHKANPEWVQYDQRNVTDDDRADLARLEKRLAELEAQA